MPRKEQHIALQFASDLKYTEMCVLVLGCIRKQLGVDDDQFFRIEISLREAVNNAIVHGNHRDAAKRVHVELEWSPLRLRLRVRDENEAVVDPHQVEDKIRGRQLLAVDGRGIMIMRSYMDRFEFFGGPGGSEVVMEKKLP